MAFKIVTGQWGGGAETKAFGGSVRWCGGGTGQNKAEWDIQIPRDGQYEVYAMWTAMDNRATNAPYHIVHAGGETVRRVNQKQDGAKWVSLGIYPFMEQREAAVILSNDADGYVIADAVKFEYCGEPVVKPGNGNEKVEIIADDEDPQFAIINENWDMCFWGQIFPLYK